MRKSFLTLISILAFAFTSAAQDDESKNCPAFSVTGPAGVVAPGELSTYIVSVDAPEVQKQGLQYSWSISSGEIVSGQGTPSIRVRRTTREGLTATVEIKGLPAGCHNAASEHSPVCDGVPIPVMIGEFDGASFRGSETDLTDIVREMNDNPTSQLYVFFAHEKKPVTPPALEREAHALNYLSSAIGGRERITSVKVFRGVDRVQFWRVPPGALNPECEGCDLASCPSISITGPAGMNVPGDSIEFTGAISGTLPPGITQEWLISAGEIVSGQGTLKIKVQTTKSSPNYTAILKVIGLPPGCPNSASETAPVVNGGDPIMLDEFDAHTKRREGPPRRCG